ncbi:MAG: CerR family C-terminal domain-containing protein [Gammaproteobacteria bacterium]|nr:CerR family C-terminal domain-containing protein [Gammaproteobacteria bacterium]
MAKDTKQRLLNAALEVFAEQGYQSATIHEIIKRAGTNIAAINYHFRDKANFYAEVVLYGCDRDNILNPGFLSDTLQPEQQLFTFIQWFLRRGLRIGADSVLDQIHMQELANPSPVLDKVVEKLIRPVHWQLRSIIKSLLPAECSEEMLRFHCFSVIGQCNLYKTGKPVMTRLYPEIELNEQVIDKATQHIFKVSLAGIRAEFEQHD